MALTWHYDVTGAEPIIRDVRVYSNATAVAVGTAMCHGAVATAENMGAAIIADADVLSNIIGVLQEAITATETSVVATGVDYYKKIIINPFAVWYGEYSQHADDDVPLTAADSTGKTATITQVTDHERGWCYITDVGSSTDGFGNLFQIGASTGTTVVTAATSYDDNLRGNAIGDTAIVLIPPFSADVAGGSVNLSAASGYASAAIEPYNATAAAGAAIVLENYIAGQNTPLQPLVCAQHSGWNYASEDPKFYGDIMFSEHLLANGGVVNDRVIT